MFRDHMSWTLALLVCTAVSGQVHGDQLPLSAEHRSCGTQGPHSR